MFWIIVSRILNDIWPEEGSVKTTTAKLITNIVILVSIAKNTTFAFDSHGAISWKIILEANLIPDKVILLLPRNNYEAYKDSGEEDNN